VTALAVLKLAISSFLKGDYRYNSNREYSMDRSRHRHTPKVDAVSASSTSTPVIDVRPDSGSGSGEDMIEYLITPHGDASKSVPARLNRVQFDVVKMCLIEGNHSSPSYRSFIVLTIPIFGVRVDRVGDGQQVLLV
jgi:hypothetical protein